tara:strand:+ start:517 stop:1188 length:672 start_codon:yes stop_codon:yes gene_type:complete
MNTSIKEKVNKLIGNKKYPVVLEIGSHYGEDTQDMIDVFDCPQIFCFEPHPGNAEFMRKHFEGFKNVSVIEIALSDKNGMASFNVIVSPLGEKPLPKKYEWIDKDDYSNLCLNDSGGCSLKNGYRNEDCKTIEVKTSRLDSWFKDGDINEIDFVWMDVQGAEKEVVFGGKEAFKRVSYVWTEFGETHYEGGMGRNETVALFDSIGFKELDSDKNNILFERIML